MIPPIEKSGVSSVGVHRVMSDDDNVPVTGAPDDVRERICEQSLRARLTGRVSVERFWIVVQPPLRVESHNPDSFSNVMNFWSRRAAYRRHFQQCIVFRYNELMWTSRGRTSLAAPRSRTVVGRHNNSVCS